MSSVGTTIRYRPDGKTLVPEHTVNRTHWARMGGTFSKVSVVLALHGQLGLTKKCIASLRLEAANLKQGCEIICIDNASPDNTQGWFDRQIQNSWQESGRWVTLKQGNEQLASRIVAALTAGSDSILDVGCGPALHTRNLPGQKLFVDLEDRGAPEPFMKLDVREVPGALFHNSFATAVALDLIEHLSKEDGLALLQNLEAIAERVVLFTPLGDLWVNQDPGPDGHHSGWLPEELEALGYRTWVFPEFHHFEDGTTHGAFWAWKGVDFTPPGLFRTLALPENRGCAGGWNTGLQQATGDVLCVLNNDTTILPDGLRRLAQAAWENGIAAQTGGVLNIRCEYVRSTSEPSEAHYPEGYALAFRRDVWQDVGLFDEAMQLGYCEDTDWGLRARSKFYRTALVPDAVHHFGSATARTILGIDRQRVCNEQTLSRRWSDQGVGCRFLIHRAGAFGDLLMATRAIRAFRDRWPVAEIQFQCNEHFVDFFQSMKFVDLVASEAHGDFDHSFDLDDVYEKSERNGIPTYPPAAFCKVLRIELGDWWYWRPQALPELVSWAEKLLPQGKRYVACGLRSCFRPKVNWSEGRWVELAQQRRDLTFVLLDPETRPGLEREGVEYDGPRIYDQRNCVDLTGKTPTYFHLTAAMAECEKCVSVDTGALHLAAALSLPTIGLIGDSPSWSRIPHTETITAFQTGDCRIDGISGFDVGRQLVYI